MKKALSELLVIALCISLTLIASGCSNNISQADEPAVETEEPSEEPIEEEPSEDSSVEHSELDGTYTDNNQAGESILTIDGNSALLEFTAFSHVGEVDYDNQTITFGDMSFDEDFNPLPVTWEYQFIGDKLVLTTDQQNVLALQTKTFYKQ